MVEGGLATLKRFIDASIWDEARVFIGDQLLQEGIKAPVIEKDIYSEVPVDSDTLIVYKND